MNNIEWTTEQPWKQGVRDALYWAYDGKIVQLVDVMGGIVYGTGDRYNRLSHVNDYTHWMGPLPVPEPPGEKEPEPWSTRVSDEQWDYLNR